MIQKNNSTEKGITAPRTDHNFKQVRVGQAPAGWREIVDVHSHPYKTWNTDSGSHMDSHDIARGVMTGRTQVVTFRDGSAERFRPSDKATWQEREKDSGAIDRRPAAGDWEQYPGAHQPYDMHARLENMSKQQQVEARSEQAASAEPPNIGGEGFVMNLGSSPDSISRTGPP